jgi:NAD+ kinase
MPPDGDGGAAVIAIIPNADKPQAMEVAVELARWAEGNGLAPALTPDDARAVGHPEWGLALERWRGARLVVVIGGDGTLLRAATMCAPLGLPLVGVNVGRLGFLTEIEVTDLYRDLAQVLAGRHHLEERMMLEATVERGGRAHARFLALNDVVVSKGPFARMVQITAYADDARLATYRADGLIVSTPTGSTAYALSAGGPVLSPELDVLVETPICPHSLATRPMVLGSACTLRVVVASPHLETLLTVDGHRGERIQPGDEVVVRRADVVARLVRKEGHDFYGLLRRKLDVDERDDREDAD